MIPWTVRQVNVRVWLTSSANLRAPMLLQGTPLVVEILVAACGNTPDFEKGARAVERDDG
jgi:hypothetical protein